MVGGIVLIDVALLTAWEVEDPLKWEQHNFTEKVRKINENSQTDKDCFILVCLIKSCSYCHFLLGPFLDPFLDPIYIIHTNE